MLDLLSLDRNAHAAALARNLGISRQSAGALIGRLRRSGLVELLPLDLGVRIPAITEEGRRRRGLANEALWPLLRRIEAIDLDERAWFVDTVERLVRTLAREDDLAGWPG